MITRAETYKKAFEIKKENLLHKTKQREMMLAAAYATNSRLNEIDMMLSSLGAKLALTALSGDTIALQNIKAQSLALSNEKNAILEKLQVNDIVYDCPVCSDTGYVNGKICACVKKIANAIAREELSAQMPIKESTFENFDLKYYSSEGDNPRRRMTAILKLCREYVINFNPNSSENLLFLGGTGLGKTHLTLAIVSGVIEKGFLPVYGPAETLFSAIQKEKYSGENQGCYDQMLNCDLLVIDDLGTEHVNSFTKSTLYNLINTRLLIKKPTIINTNLSLKEIQEIYSPRIASRLIGNFNGNQFLGTDIRQQKLLGK